MRRFPVCLLLLLGVSVFCAGSVFWAAPAAAHETDESDSVASDARSSVVADDLPPGVSLEVLQNGLALRLRNATSAQVFVRQPALHVSPGESVQWHLDAAHPSSAPALRTWRVDIDVDGAPHQVLGEVRRTPGPAPWPWLVGAVLVAGGLAGTARRLRRPGWLAVPLGLAVLTSTAHTAAALAARTAQGPRWALLGDYLPQGGCWALGALAAGLLARGRAGGAGLAALAALGLALVTLVRDGAVLGASTVLVTLPADLDRALVAATVGLAAGALAGLLLGRSTIGSAQSRTTSG